MRLVNTRMYFPWQATVCSLVLVVAGAAIAAEPVSWLSGRAVQQQLEQPVSASWSRMSVRHALKRLARSVRVPMILDRRVDPSRSLELTVQSQPLAAALAKIAEQQKIGVSMLGPVAYFGPADTAARLRTASALQHEAIAKLPAAVKRKLLQAKPWHWPDASEPKTLLAQLAEEAGVRIDGQQLVEHDLWTETDLPALAWIDRLALVAIQYDLTLEFSSDGRTVTLVPLPENVAMTKSYPAAGKPDALAAKWRREFPQAIIEVDGDKLSVTARVEDHQQIEQKLKPATARKTERVIKGEQLYTISHDGVPLDKLLAQLATQIGLTIHYDQTIAKAGIALDQRVAIKVKQVPLQEVLDAALSQAHLKATVRGKDVDVRLAD